MTATMTQLQCDHCTCTEFEVYRTDDSPVIYIRCAGCQGSLITARTSDARSS